MQRNESRYSKLIRTFLPEAWNPLYSLGATTFYLFWIVAVSGLYLFVFFETSIEGAFDSVEFISNEQYLIGSIVRGLHRYASAAMAITVTLHLIRELVKRRFVGARWFSWISGVPLIWLLFASAIGGYWLVWDEKAQYIALTTARLFDVLPIVVEPMAFGLIDNATVSDRFFSLLIFLHVGIPLALLLGMFIHIKRINNARIFPQKDYAAWMLGCLVVLSLVIPATSMGPANLDAPIRSVEIDWFYMNVYPLIDIFGPTPVWALLSILTLALLVLPLLVRDKNQHLAVVDPDFCNGCGWCFADCPYEAIYMKPHDYKRNNEQAVVIAENCVGCGICAGACPSVTPFKSFDQAKSGIDLLDFKNSDVLVDARNKVAELDKQRRILVVGCAHGVDLGALESEHAAVIELECIGQLPPSYMDFLCRRDDVDAVLLTGCSSDNCYHRLGIELQEERLHRLREPHLRYADVKEKIERLWIGKGGEQQLAATVAEMKRALEQRSAEDAGTDDKDLVAQVLEAKEQERENP
ncbi:MAG: 4Fe-4S binding protein [Pseudomonadales bacterium]